MASWCLRAYLSLLALFASRSDHTTFLLLPVFGLPQPAVALLVQYVMIQHALLRYGCCGYLCIVATFSHDLSNIDFQLLNPCLRAAEKIAGLCIPAPALQLLIFSACSSPFLVRTRFSALPELCVGGPICPVPPPEMFPAVLLSVKTCRLCAC